MWKMQVMGYPYAPNVSQFSPQLLVVDVALNLLL